MLPGHGQVKYLANQVKRKSRKLCRCATVCYLIIDSFNVCVGFVNPLTTVTNLQESQEKFHGFSTFVIILLVYFLEFLLYHYLTRYDSGHRCPTFPYGRQGNLLYYICIYHTPPPNIPYPPKKTQLAPLRKTVKPTLK